MPARFVGGVDNSCSDYTPYEWGSACGACEELAWWTDKDDKVATVALLPWSEALPAHVRNRR